MSDVIDFYFDFSSTYSYVAHQDIMSLARKHDLTLSWRPISLGAIFHQQGHSLPKPGSPKQKYLWHDVQRAADQAGLSFRWPDIFPVNSIPAARGAYWIQDIMPEKLEAYIASVFTTTFATDHDIGQPETLQDIAKNLGLDDAAYMAALKDDVYKDRLKQETAAAQTRGVFGAPTFCFGDEMFWGADRLAALDSFITKQKA